MNFMYSDIVGDDIFQAIFCLPLGSLPDYLEGITISESTKPLDMTESSPIMATGTTDGLVTSLHLGQDCTRSPVPLWQKVTRT
jgi:hypothetical protein